MTAPEDEHRNGHLGDQVGGEDPDHEPRHEPRHEHGYEHGDRAGQLAAEAVKLIGAFAEVATEWVSECAAAWSNHSARPWSDEHHAAEEEPRHEACCRRCPLCRALDAAHQAGPELGAQMTGTATVLLDMAARWMSVAPTSRGPADSRVEHINLDHDLDDPDADAPAPGSGQEEP